MKFIQKLRAVFAALPLLVSCSVAYAATPTPFTFDARHTTSSPARLANACAVNVVSINDKRFNKEGISLRTAVPAGPPEQWISASLDSLVEYGFDVQRHS